ncbi:MAG: hypothetical protein KGZ42_10150 [Melioribacter sp.]|nr:hypothetical protein [Melioribacter sp.]
MGSQQLLLIVVGLIAVALMVYTGLTIMKSYYETSNRDQLISSLNNLAILAQQYYKRPVEQGGGGGAYARFTIPLNLRSTIVGNFNASARGNRVDFSATGVEIGRNGKTVVSVTCRVDRDGVRFTITN